MYTDCCYEAHFVFNTLKGDENHPFEVFFQRSLLYIIELKKSDDSQDSIDSQKIRCVELCRQAQAFLKNLLSINAEILTLEICEDIDGKLQVCIAVKC